MLFVSDNLCTFIYSSELSDAERRHRLARYERKEQEKKQKQASTRSRALLAMRGQPRREDK